MATRIIRRGATQPKETALERRKAALKKGRFAPTKPSERRGTAYVTPARRKILERERVQDTKYAKVTKGSLIPEERARIEREEAAAKVKEAEVTVPVEAKPEAPVVTEEVTVRTPVVEEPKKQLGEVIGTSKELFGKGKSEAPTGLRKYTYMFMPPTEKVFGTRKERREYLEAYSKWREKRKETPLWTIDPYSHKVAEFGYGALTGLYSGIREQPEKAAIVGGVAAGVALTGGLITIPAAAVPVATGVGVGLTTWWGLKTGAEVKAAKGEFKGEKVGEIISTEVVPFLVGGGIGGKIAPKIKGLWKTRFRKKIEAEDLIDPDVLSGKKQFPEADPSKHYELFTKPSKHRIGEDPMGYHATAQKLDTTVGKGASEFEGLYISYEPSPHFLRLDKSTSAIYDPSLFTGTDPKVAAITPKRFVVGKKGKIGEAFIPKIKREVEAVITPGTKLIQTGKEFYFKYKGVRVPIDQFGVEGGITKVDSKTGKDVVVFAKDVLGSYYLPSDYAPVTSASFAGGLISSFITDKKVSKKEVKEEKIVDYTETEPSRPSVPKSRFIAPYGRGYKYRRKTIPERPIFPVSRRPSVKREPSRPIEEFKPPKEEYIPIIREPSRPVRKAERVVEPIREYRPSRREGIRERYEREYDIIKRPLPIPPLTFGLKKEKVTRITKPREFRYTPSIVGVEAQIFAKPPKEDFTFTGLGLRPIPISLKPKKKKKRRDSFIDFNFNFRF